MPGMTGVESESDTFVYVGFFFCIFDAGSGAEDTMKLRLRTPVS